MNTQLIHRTAKKLLAFIERWQGERLPNSSVLARELGVSKPTALAAMRMLAADGVLQVHRGAAATIRARHGGGDPPRPAAAAERLAADLRNAVRLGRIRAGDEVPKRDTLVRDYGVSARTVQRALAALHAEKLLVRRGRRLLVGGRHIDAGNRPRRAGTRALYVVLWHRWQWQEELADRRTSPFFTTLSETASRHGVRLVPTLARGAYDAASLPFPEGVDGARRAALRAGHEILGVLVPFRKKQLPPDEWTEYCSRAQIPLVWFDRWNIGPSGAELGPSAVRCVFDGPSMVRVCLSYLYDHGHRDIVFRCHGEPWQLERGAHLAAEARRYPGMELRTVGPLYTDSEPDRIRDEVARALLMLREGSFPFRDSVLRLCDITFGEREAEFLPYLDSSGPGALEDRVVAMLRAHHERSQAFDDVGFILDTLCLLPALSDRGATAIIVPNDWHGYMVMRRLGRLGYSVPGDLSVISFDNTSRFTLFPLTSVDPGFDTLGYQAVHAILGDVPTAVDDSRDIWTSPWVADHGTVADAPTVR